MKDESKTKKQLITELEGLRRQFADTEKEMKESGDITERKRAEEALRLEKEFGDRILNAGEDTIFVFDPNTGKALRWNEAFTRISGYSNEEIAEMKAPDSWYSQEDIERAYAHMDEIMKGNTPSAIELSLITKNGTLVPTEYVATIVKDEDGNPTSIISVGRDVTERERVEAELRAEKDKLQVLMDGLAATEIGINIIGLDRIIQLQNSVLIDRFGDLIGKPCYRHYMGLDAPCDFCPMELIVATNTKQSIEFTGADGRHYQLLASPLQNTEGIVDRVIEVVIDVTERKQAEEDYHLLLEEMSDGYLVVQDGKYVFANSRCEEIFGYEPGEIADIPFDQMVAPASHEDAVGMYEQMLSGEETAFWRHEGLGKKKDGTEIIVEATIKNIEYRDKPALAAVIRDITERRRMERLLAESEHKYRMLADNVLDVIWTMDLNFNLTYVSPSVTKQRGYEVEEALSQSLEDILTPASLKVAMEVLVKGLAQSNSGGGDPGGMKNIENIGLEMKCKDGSTIWTETTASILFDQSGVAIGILGMSRDVTERKRAEKTLAERMKELRCLYSVTSIIHRADITSEEKYKEVVNVIPQGWQYPDVACARVIIGTDEFRSSSYRKTKWKQTSDIVMYGSKVGIIEVGYLEERPECYEGPFLEEERNLIDGISKHLADYIKRRRAEQELYKSEEKYRRLVESLNREYVIYSHDTQGIFTYISPSIINVLGYTQDEFMRNYAEYMTDNPINEKVEGYTNAALRGEMQESYEAEYWHKNGSRVQIRVTEAPVFDDDGNVLGIEGIVQDITELKRAEASLRESEEKLRLLYDSVPVGVVVSDLEGRIIDINDGLMSMRGCDDKEGILGLSCFELFAERDQSRVMQVRKDIIKAGSSEACRYNFVREDGSEFPVTFNAALLKDADDKPLGIVAIGLDMTQQQKMQEQLMLADRLSSIGQLAAGIAHELNNPLGGIIGLSDLLLGGDLPGEVREDVEVIEREARRAANIVKGLLTFAWSKGNAKAMLDINGLIQEVLQLRYYDQSEMNIEVDVFFAPDLPLIPVNGAQIQQVIINLITNAEQAMFENYGKGRLTVKTEEVEDMVRITVSDDGPGITPENMKKLFIPFFTTREIGQGTGLGLSICHGIVTENGGRIYAESEPGKGASFIVELPMSA